MKDDRSLFSQKWVKVTGLVTAIVFSFTNIAWADGIHVATSLRSLSHPDPEKDKPFFPTIPASLGKIKKTYQASPSLVIHIQDAHGNEEAQKNIAALLLYLVQNHHLEVINLEGAEGILEPAFLTFFPSQEARRKVADYLLREGRLSGAEYLAVVDNLQAVTLYGAEDEPLYQKNREIFLKSLAFQNEDEKILGQVEKWVKDLARFEFSKELYEMTMAQLRFQEKGDLIGYIKKLSGPNQTLKQYPSLKSLTDLLQLEQKIQFETAEEELRGFTRDLKKLLSPERLSKFLTYEVHFKHHPIERAEFYQFLKTEFWRLPSSVRKNYPELIRYFEYMIIREGIDLSLFTELETLEKETKEKLFRNGTERKLDHLIKIFDIYQRLVHFELSKEDAEFFLEHRNEFNVELIRNDLEPLLAKHRFSVEWPAGLAVLDEHLKIIEQFYHHALKRDSVLIENAVKKMEASNSKITALISGGFHTPGFEKYLEEKGYSFMTVVPVISKASDQNKDNQHYQDALSQKPMNLEKVLVDSYFSSRSHLANDPRFQLAAEPLLPTRASRTELREVIHGRASRLVRNKYSALLMAMGLAYFLSVQEKGGLEAVRTEITQAATKQSLENRKILESWLDPFKHAAYQAGVLYLPRTSGRVDAVLQVQENNEIRSRFGGRTTRDMQIDLDPQTKIAAVPGIDPVRLEPEVLAKLALSDTPVSFSNRNAFTQISARPHNRFKKAPVKAPVQRSEMRKGTRTLERSMERRKTAKLIRRPGVIAVKTVIQEEPVPTGPVQFPAFLRIAFVYTAGAALLSLIPMTIHFGGFAFFLLTPAMLLLLLPLGTFAVKWRTERKAIIRVKVPVQQKRKMDPDLNLRSTEEWLTQNSYQDSPEANTETLVQEVKTLGMNLGATRVNGFVYHDQVPELSDQPTVSQIANRISIQFGIEQSHLLMLAEKASVSTEDSEISKWIFIWDQLKAANRSHYFNLQSAKDPGFFAELKHAFKTPGLTGILRFARTFFILGPHLLIQFFYGWWMKAIGFEWVASNRDYLGRAVTLRILTQSLSSANQEFFGQDFSSWKNRTLMQQAAYHTLLKLKSYQKKMTDLKYGTSQVSAWYRFFDRTLIQPIIAPGITFIQRRGKMALAGAVGVGLIALFPMAVDPNLLGIFGDILIEMTAGKAILGMAASKLVSFFTLTSLLKAIWLGMVFTTPMFYRGFYHQHQDQAVLNQLEGSLLREHLPHYADRLYKARKLAVENKKGKLAALKLAETGYLDISVIRNFWGTALRDKNLTADQRTQMAQELWAIFSYIRFNSDSELHDFKAFLLESLPQQEILETTSARAPPKTSLALKFVSSLKAGLRIATSPAYLMTIILFAGSMSVVGSEIATLYGDPQTGEQGLSGYADSAVSDFTGVEVPLFKPGVELAEHHALGAAEHALHSAEQAVGISVSDTVYHSGAKVLDAAGVDHAMHAARLNTESIDFARQGKSAAEVGEIRRVRYLEKELPAMQSGRTKELALQEYAQLRYAQAARQNQSVQNPTETNPTLPPQSPTSAGHTTAARPSIIEESPEARQIREAYNQQIQEERKLRGEIEQLDRNKAVRETDLSGKKEEFVKRLRANLEEQLTARFTYQSKIEMIPEIQKVLEEKWIKNHVSEFVVVFLQELDKTGAEGKGGIFTGGQPEYEKALAETFKVLSRNTEFSEPIIQLLKRHIEALIQTRFSKEAQEDKNILTLRPASDKPLIIDLPADLERTGTNALTAERIIKEAIEYRMGKKIFNEPGKENKTLKALRDKQRQIEKQHGKGGRWKVSLIGQAAVLQGDLKDPGRFFRSGFLNGGIEISYKVRDAAKAERIQFYDKNFDFKNLLEQKEMIEIVKRASELTSAYQRAQSTLYVLEDSVKEELEFQRVGRDGIERNIQQMAKRAQEDGLDLQASAKYDQNIGRDVQIRIQKAKETVADVTSQIGHLIGVVDKKIEIDQSVFTLSTGEFQMNIRTVLKQLLNHQPIDLSQGITESASVEEIEAEFDTTIKQLVIEEEAVKKLLYTAWQEKRNLNKDIVLTFRAFANSLTNYDLLSALSMFFEGQRRTSQVYTDDRALILIEKTLQYTTLEKQILVLESRLTEINDKFQKYQNIRDTAKKNLKDQLDSFEFRGPIDKLPPALKDYINAALGFQDVRQEMQALQREAEGFNAAVSRSVEEDKNDIRSGKVAKEYYADFFKILEVQPRTIHQPQGFAKDVQEGVNLELLHQQILQFKFNHEMADMIVKGIRGEKGVPILDQLVLFGRQFSVSKQVTDRLSKIINREEKVYKALRKTYEKEKRLDSEKMEELKGLRTEKNAEIERVMSYIMPGIWYAKLQDMKKIVNSKKMSEWSPEERKMHEERFLDLKNLFAQSIEKERIQVEADLNGLKAQSQAAKQSEIKKLERRLAEIEKNREQIASWSKNSWRTNQLDALEIEGRYVNNDGETGWSVGPKVRFTFGQKTRGLMESFYAVREGIRLNQEKAKYDFALQSYFKYENLRQVHERVQIYEKMAQDFDQEVKVLQEVIARVRDSSYFTVEFQELQSKLDTFLTQVRRSPDTAMELFVEFEKRVNEFDETLLNQPESRRLKSNLMNIRQAFEDWKSVKQGNDTTNNAELTGIDERLKQLETEFKKTLEASSLAQLKKMNADLAAAKHQQAKAAEGLRSLGEVRKQLGLEYQKLIWPLQQKVHEFDYNILNGAELASGEDTILKQLKEAEASFNPEINKQIWDNHVRAAWALSSAAEDGRGIPVEILGQYYSKGPGFFFYSPFLNLTETKFKKISKATAQMQIRIAFDQKESYLRTVDRTHESLNLVLANTTEQHQKSLADLKEHQKLADEIRPKREAATLSKREQANIHEAVRAVNREFLKDQAAITSFNHTSALMRKAVLPEALKVQDRGMKEEVSLDKEGTKKILNHLRPQETDRRRNLAQRIYQIQKQYSRLPLTIGVMGLMYPDKIVNTTEINVGIIGPRGPIGIEKETHYSEEEKTRFTFGLHASYAFLEALYNRDARIAETEYKQWQLWADRHEREIESAVEKAAVQVRKQLDNLQATQAYSMRFKALYEAIKRVGFDPLTKIGFEQELKNIALRIQTDQRALEKAKIDFLEAADLPVGTEVKINDGTTLFVINPEEQVKLDVLEKKYLEEVKNRAQNDPQMKAFLMDIDLARLHRINAQWSRWLSSAFTLFSGFTTPGDKGVIDARIEVKLHLIDHGRTLHKELTKVTEEIMRALEKNKFLANDIEFDALNRYLTFLRARVEFVNKTSEYLVANEKSIHFEKQYVGVPQREQNIGTVLASLSESLNSEYEQITAFHGLREAWIDFETVIKNLNMSQTFDFEKLLKDGKYPVTEDIRGRWQEEDKDRQAIVNGELEEEKKKGEEQAKRIQLESALAAAVGLGASLASEYAELSKQQRRPASVQQENIRQRLKEEKKSEIPDIEGKGAALPNEPLRGIINDIAKIWEIDRLRWDPIPASRGNQVPELGSFPALSGPLLIQLFEGTRESFTLSPAKNLARMQLIPMIHERFMQEPDGKSKLQRLAQILDQAKRSRSERYPIDFGKYFEKRLSSEQVTALTSEFAHSDDKRFSLQQLGFLDYFSLIILNNLPESVVMDGKTVDLLKEVDALDQAIRNGEFPEKIADKTKKISAAALGARKGISMLVEKHLTFLEMGIHMKHDRPQPGRKDWMPPVVRQNRDRYLAVLTQAGMFSVDAREWEKDRDFEEWIAIHPLAEEWKKEHPNQPMSEAHSNLLKDLFLMEKYIEWRSLLDRRFSEASFAELLLGQSEDKSLERLRQIINYRVFNKNIALYGNSQDKANLLTLQFTFLVWARLYHPDENIRLDNVEKYTKIVNRLVDHRKVLFNRLYFSDPSQKDFTEEQLLQRDEADLLRIYKSLPEKSFALQNIIEAEKSNLSNGLFLGETMHRAYETAVRYLKKKSAELGRPLEMYDLSDTQIEEIFKEIADFYQKATDIKKILEKNTDGESFYGQTLDPLKPQHQGAIQAWYEFMTRNGLDLKELEELIDVSRKIKPAIRRLIGESFNPWDPRDIGLITSHAGNILGYSGWDEALIEKVPAAVRAYNHWLSIPLEDRIKLHSVILEISKEIKQPYEALLNRTLDLRRGRDQQGRLGGDAGKLFAEARNFLFLSGTRPNAAARREFENRYDLKLTAEGMLDPSSIPNITPQKVQRIIAEAKDTLQRALEMRPTADEILREIDRGSTPQTPARPMPPAAAPRPVPIPPAARPQAEDESSPAQVLMAWLGGKWSSASTAITWMLSPIQVGAQTQFERNSEQGPALLVQNAQPAPTASATAQPVPPVPEITLNLEIPEHMGFLMSLVEEGPEFAERLLLILRSDIFNQYLNRIQKAFRPDYDFRKNLRSAFEGIKEDPRDYYDISGRLSYYIHSYNSIPDLEKDIVQKMALMDVLEKKHGSLPEAVKDNESRYQKTQTEYALRSKSTGLPNEAVIPSAQILNVYEAEKNAFMLIQKSNITKEGWEWTEDIARKMVREFQIIFFESLLSQYTDYFNQEKINVTSSSALVVERLNRIQNFTNWLNAYPVRYEIQDLSQNEGFRDYLDQTAKKNGIELTAENQDTLYLAYQNRFLFGVGRYWLDRNFKPGTDGSRPLTEKEIGQLIESRKSVWKYFSRYWQAEGMPLSKGQAAELSSIRNFTDAHYETFFKETTYMQSLSRQYLNRDLLFHELLFWYLDIGNLAWDLNRPDRVIWSEISGFADKKAGDGSIAYWRIENTFKNVLTNPKDVARRYNLSIGPDQEILRLILSEGQRKTTRLFSEEVITSLKGLYGSKITPEQSRRLLSIFDAVSDQEEALRELVLGKMPLTAQEVSTAEGRLTFVRHRLLMSRDVLTLSDVEARLIAEGKHEDFVRRLNVKNHVRLSRAGVLEWTENLRTSKRTPEQLKALANDLHVFGENIKLIYKAPVQPDSLIRTIDTVKFGADERQLRQRFVVAADQYLLRMANRLLDMPNTAISLSPQEIDEKDPKTLLSNWNAAFNLGLNNDTMNAWARILQRQDISRVRLKTIFVDVRMLKDNLPSASNDILFQIASRDQVALLKRGGLISGEPRRLSKDESENQYDLKSSMVFDAENRTRHAMEEYAGIYGREQTARLSGGQTASPNQADLVQARDRFLKEVISEREYPMVKSEQNKKEAWNFLNKISGTFILGALLLQFFSLFASWRLKRTATPAHKPKIDPATSRGNFHPQKNFRVTPPLGTATPEKPAAELNRQFIIRMSLAAVLVGAMLIASLWVPAFMAFTPGIISFWILTLWYSLVKRFPAGMNPALFFQILVIVSVALFFVGSVAYFSPDWSNLLPSVVVTWGAAIFYLSIDLGKIAMDRLTTFTGKRLSHQKAPFEEVNQSQREYIELSELIDELESNTGAWNLHQQRLLHDVAVRMEQTNWFAKSEIENIQTKANEMMGAHINRQSFVNDLRLIQKMLKSSIPNRYKTGIKKFTRAMSVKELKEVPLKNIEEELRNNPDPNIVGILVSSAPISQEECRRQEAEVNKLAKELGRRIYYFHWSWPLATENVGKKYGTMVAGVPFLRFGLNYAVTEYQKYTGRKLRADVPVIGGILLGIAASVSYFVGFSVLTTLSIGAVLLFAVQYVVSGATARQVKVPSDLKIEEQMEAIFGNSEFVDLQKVVSQGPLFDFGGGSNLTELGFNVPHFDIRNAKDVEIIDESLRLWGAFVMDDKNSMGYDLYMNIVKMLEDEALTQMPARILTRIHQDLGASFLQGIREMIGRNLATAEQINRWLADRLNANFKNLIHENRLTTRQFIEWARAHHIPLNSRNQIELTSPDDFENVITQIMQAADLPEGIKAQIIFQDLFRFFIQLDKDGALYQSLATDIQRTASELNHIQLGIDGLMHQFRQTGHLDDAQKAMLKELYYDQLTLKHQSESMRKQREGLLKNNPNAGQEIISRGNIALSALKNIENSIKTELEHEGFSEALKEYRHFGVIREAVAIAAHPDNRTATVVTPEIEMRNDGAKNQSQESDDGKTAQSTGSFHGIRLRQTINQDEIFYGKTFYVFDRALYGPERSRYAVIPYAHAIGSTLGAILGFWFFGGFAAGGFVAGLAAAGLPATIGFFMGGMILGAWEKSYINTGIGVIFYGDVSHDYAEPNGLFMTKAIFEEANKNYDAKNKRNFRWGRSDSWFRYLFLVRQGVPYPVRSNVFWGAKSYYNSPIFAIFLTLGLILVPFISSVADRIYPIPRWLEFKHQGLLWTAFGISMTIVVFGSKFAGLSYSWVLSHTPDWARSRSTTLQQLYETRNRSFVLGKPALKDVMQETFDSILTLLNNIWIEVKMLLHYWVRGAANGIHPTTTSDQPHHESRFRIALPVLIAANILLGLVLFSPAVSMWILANPFFNFLLLPEFFFTALSSTPLSIFLTLNPKMMMLFIAVASIHIGHRLLGRFIPIGWNLTSVFTGAVIIPMMFLIPIYLIAEPATLIGFLTQVIQAINIHAPIFGLEALPVPSLTGNLMTFVGLAAFAAYVFSTLAQWLHQIVGDKQSGVLHDPQPWLTFVAGAALSSLTALAAALIVVPNLLPAIIASLASVFYYTHLWPLAFGCVMLAAWTVGLFPIWHNSKTKINFPDIPENFFLIRIWKRLATIIGNDQKVYDEAAAKPIGTPGKIDKLKEKIAIYLEVLVDQNLANIIRQRYKISNLRTLDSENPQRPNRAGQTKTYTEKLRESLIDQGDLFLIKVQDRTVLPNQSERIVLKRIKDLLIEIEEAKFAIQRDRLKLRNTRSDKVRNNFFLVGLVVGTALFSVLSTRTLYLAFANASLFGGVLSGGLVLGVSLTFIASIIAIGLLFPNSRRLNHVLIASSIIGAFTLFGIAYWNSIFTFESLWAIVGYLWFIPVTGHAFQLLAHLVFSINFRGLLSEEFQKINMAVIQPIILWWKKYQIKQLLNTNMPTLSEHERLYNHWLDKMNQTHDPAELQMILEQLPTANGLLEENRTFLIQRTAFKYYKILIIAALTIKDLDRLNDQISQRVHLFTPAEKDTLLALIDQRRSGLSDALFIALSGRIDAAHDSKALEALAQEINDTLELLEVQKSALLQKLTPKYYRIKIESARILDQLENLENDIQQQDLGDLIVTDRDALLASIRVKKERVGLLRTLNNRIEGMNQRNQPQLQELSQRIGEASTLRALVKIAREVRVLTPEQISTDDKKKLMDEISVKKAARSRQLNLNRRKRQLQVARQARVAQQRALRESQTFVTRPDFLRQIQKAPNYSSLMNIAKAVEQDEKLSIPAKKDLVRRIVFKIAALIPGIQEEKELNALGHKLKDLAEFDAFSRAALHQKIQTRKSELSNRRSELREAAQSAEEMRMEFGGWDNMLGIIEERRKASEDLNEAIVRSVREAVVQAGVEQPIASNGSELSNLPGSAVYVWDTDSETQNQIEFVRSILRHVSLKTRAIIFLSDTQKDIEPILKAQLAGRIIIRYGSLSDIALEEMRYHRIQHDNVLQVTEVQTLLRDPNAEVLRKGVAESLTRFVPFHVLIIGGDKKAFFGAAFRPFELPLEAIMSRWAAEFEVSKAA